MFENEKIEYTLSLGDDYENIIDISVRACLTSINHAGFK